MKSFDSFHKEEISFFTLLICMILVSISLCFLQLCVTPGIFIEPDIHADDVFYMLGPYNSDRPAGPREGGYVHLDSCS